MTKSSIFETRACLRGRSALAITDVSSNVIKGLSHFVTEVTFPVLLAALVHSPC